MGLMVSILSVVAWITLELMILLDPSGTLPIRAFSFLGAGFFILSAICTWILPWSANRINNPRRFFRVFFAGFMFLMFFSCFGGYVFHRDFYTYATQIIVLYYALFLLRLDHIGIVTRKTAVYRVLSLSAVVVFALWTIWLMMMAYAIVVRIEPRWIEATAYNLINGLIGIVLVVAAGLLWENSKRTVHFIGGDIYFDERKISAILSPQEGRILAAYLNAPDRTMTCRVLFEHLAEAGEESDKIPLRCGTCLRERWTASDCPTYRNLKNRIGDTKKYLELLQIGTIVPASENPREIKEFGWCLRLFDDVRYEPKEQLVFGLKKSAKPDVQ